MDGTGRKVLLHNDLLKPRAIALHPKAGWVEQSDGYNRCLCVCVCVGGGGGGFQKDAFILLLLVGVGWGLYPYYKIVMGNPFFFNQKKNKTTIYIFF